MTPAAFEIVCPSCGLRTGTPTLLCPRCREPLPLSCGGDCASCADRASTCGPTPAAGAHRRD